LDLDRQRLDKWLWHARVVRTRRDAAALANGGHIRVNGGRIAEAGRALRVGDVVTVALTQRVRILKVERFVERRGSAAAGRSLYEELSHDSGMAAPTLPSLAKG
jgi:ribosome-associated heat shock protein Hsp15